MVVSGLPRSGTSLLMQMLGAGGLPLLVDGRRPPDRHNPRGYFEFDLVRRRGAEEAWIGRARGRAVKVVVPRVLELPRGGPYRILFLHRSAAEVAASQAAMLEGAVEPGAGLPPSRVAEVLLALRDRVRAGLADRPDMRILDLEHREVLLSPRREAGRIARFLDLDLDLAAMVACVEPELARHTAAAGPTAGA